MFWWIYITAVLICSYQVGKIFKKNKLLVFFFTAIIFLTPAQLEISSINYAPSVFTFIFNALFEQNFSSRPLRTLLISLPLSLFLLLCISLIKRKFF
tara:strand:+ start:1022 stop:1312 length:291 start_codon:yes stop_codon:yes gene_type:complete